MTTSSNGVRSQRARQQEYRRLPAVDALLRSDELALLVAEYGAAAVTTVVRTLLDDARTAIAAGGSAPPAAAWLGLVDERLAASLRPSLRPVINATGIIVHTNLGRAPLSAAARAAVDSVARSYSNLEYDLVEGRRGSRHLHATQLLAELTGADDAIVVNNNAAAIYLVLGAFCRARDVLISRGQLVEIGGGFRIPDVLHQSGARLVEVGTTNRTHIHDFAAALTDETAAVLRVHSSNFRQVGFVTQPSLAELAALVQDKRHVTESAPSLPLLIDDLGSGTLLATETYGLAPEPLVQASVAAGADLITFSGDKLLGGPQAGIIIGRKGLIAQLRRHPLARALRVDKLTLAALTATLQSYQRGRAPQELPVWQMISATPDELARRAAQWQAALQQAGIEAAVEAGESAVGGGSLPGETLPTQLLALLPDAPDALAARLRRSDPPVLGRIRQERLLLDPRTVGAEEEEALVAKVIAAWRERERG